MNKSDLILLLLHENNKKSIQTITQFQKLVFLVQKQVLDKSKHTGITFDFGPDRFGPLSVEVYDELKFLKSVEMIREGIDREYVITDKGVRFVEEKTLPKVPEDMRKGISYIKEKYGEMKIIELLSFIYLNYDHFVINSDILATPQN